MKQLNRMVTAYLDFAENMTLRHIPLTMQDWEKRLNSFIEMFDYGILQDAGKVSAEIAKLHAETEFESTVSFRTDCLCLILINICWNKRQAGSQSGCSVCTISTKKPFSGVRKILLLIQRKVTLDRIFGVVKRRKYHCWYFRFSIFSLPIVKKLWYNIIIKMYLRKGA